MTIIVFSAHPLRQTLIDKGVTLSQLREAMGGRPSESRLSYFLTGKRPMPERVRAAITEALRQMGVL